MKDCKNKITNVNALAKTLHEDIEFIQKQAQHNHPGWLDEQNPGFRRWLIDGAQAALTNVSSINTEANVIKRLRQYMAGFADIHFTIAFNKQLEPPLWAGICLAYEGGQYVVRHRATNWPVPLPDIGNVLLSCDGRPADEVMKEDVLRNYFYELSSSFPKNTFAAYLLINRNRYKSCTFSDQNGFANTYSLHWSDFDFLINHPRFIMMEKVAHYSIKNLSGTYWVRLSSFQPEKEDMKRFHTLLKTLESISIEEKETVVFDLRGNNGGDSRLGDEIFIALYGKDRFHKIDAIREGEIKVMRRASADNYSHIRNENIPHAIARYGEGSTWHKIIESIANRMEASFMTGEQFVQENDLYRKEALINKNFTPIDHSHPPRVVAITDECCGSACLDFMDFIKSIPGHIHLGKETAGDAVYNEVRSIELPSGLGRLIIPQKIFRNRKRGNNESYKPDKEFLGNIYDDDAVENWTLSLLEYI